MPCQPVRMSSFLFVLLADSGMYWIEAFATGVPVPASVTVPRTSTPRGSLTSTCFTRSPACHSIASSSGVYRDK